MARRIMVSFDRATASRLLANGPRRDLLEVATAAGAEVVYASGGRSRGLWGRLFGGHVRQGVRTALATRAGDTVLADGEHTGIPYALTSALLPWRQPSHVVVIGHLVTRPWKLAALAVASRTGTRGTLVLHSVEQERRVKRWLGRRWTTRLVPYQVDTEYWLPGVERPQGRPLIVAVGAENRDYSTFCAAVEGIDGDVVVAAGSHWARNDATAGAMPSNLTWLDKPLPFADLRALYQRSAIAVVPLSEVPNQSGVTVILEAMSGGLPVIVTATAGQRECISGPLVRAESGLEGPPAPSRGPALLLADAAEECGVTGLYVPPGDPVALRRAIELLLASDARRAAIGANARASATANFSIERFVATLSSLLETV